MVDGFSGIETAKETKVSSASEVLVGERILEKDRSLTPENFPPYKGLNEEKKLVIKDLGKPFVEDEEGWEIVRPFYHAKENPVSVLCRGFIEGYLKRRAPLNQEQQRILRESFELKKLDQQFHHYEELSPIIELGVLEDRLLGRLGVASDKQRSKVERDLRKVQEEIVPKILALQQEIRPNLEAVAERLKPFFEETERITYLLKKELAPLLGEEEIERRLMELWKDTHILPQDKYENACFCEGNIDPKVSPGFVGHGYFEDDLVDRIFALASEKGLEYITEVFTHEAIHRLSKPPIRRKIEPVEFDEWGAHTERVVRYFGPLTVEWKDFYLDATSEEEISLSYRKWMAEKVNYENGEWLLWEAITDWQASEIFTQIHPSYKFKTGYWEKTLVGRIVQLADEKGVDIRLAIKKGLVLGAKPPLISALRQVLGEGNHYEKLVSLMKHSEELQAEKDQGKIDEKTFVQRGTEEVVKPFKEYLKVSPEQELRL